MDYIECIYSVSDELVELFESPTKVECSSSSGIAYKTQCGNMMTSSNGNIFHVTGPSCGEFTSDRWIPLTKADDAELWWFLWSTREQTVE